MKKATSILLLLFFSTVYGQIPAYYSGVDFSLSGLELKEELGDLITSTHTSPTSYSEVWDVLKVADLDPTNSAVVLLIYGYDDGGGVVSDRTRDKDENGGDVGDWNREHVFPKSLGAPNLGTSGPGSDPHNLRASDVTANGNRSNRKFAAGTGNANTVGTNWFPGEEWKGDAARIIMYMYLRYGNRCLPSAAAVGTTNAIDGNMINVLLDWNAADEVSTFEINRNNAIYAAIGNRNPFIDNPHIANRIWGGAEATDTWGNLSLAEEITGNKTATYPNPVINDILYVSSCGENQVESIRITDLQGRTVLETQFQEGISSISVNTSSIPNGYYLVNISTLTGIETKKICIH